ncbi:phosphatase PAP2 family protein [Nocardioides sambongensis]|uniref:phosphatase PAP2 family protein n=1 Tax=Nocardioides sambongensis TaxID=2589074 RepID=UPI001E5B2933|nr:phosphatase PAP2 family protein [Nocardioides sambongensis]
MNTWLAFRRSARMFALAWGCGLVLAAVMVVMAVTLDLPILDPDGVAMPAYLRMPLIVLAALAVDVVPRIVHRARVRRSGPTGLGPITREVMRERWPAAQWWFAINGVLAWYLTYAAFRNVKSMAPFANTREWDESLSTVDQFLFAGHDPAGTLHAWFGTGLAAHLFSLVYIAWIVLVPVSIAVALVWTRHTSAGAWYVTAIAVDWFLGAVVYLLVPTVGPIYSDPGQFADLPHTYVTTLQDDMWADRLAVMADPWGAGTLQTIAAFASLHVGIMVSICLLVRLLGLPAWVDRAGWVFLALTILATVYLGWHFAVDVLGGAALGAFAVWVSGLATGNRVGWRVRLVRPRETPAAAGSTDPAGASGGHHAPPG